MPPFLRSAQAKLALAGALLLLLLVLAPRGGVSAMALARLVLGGAAVAGMAFWVRHQKQGGKARFALPPRLQVASRTQLSAKCSLALVEADGRAYLVAFGDGFANIQPAPRKTSARRDSPARRRRSAASESKAGVL